MDPRSLLDTWTQILKLDSVVYNRDDEPRVYWGQKSPKKNSAVPLL